MLFVHSGQLWTICARFGVGKQGRRFPVCRLRRSFWTSKRIAGNHAGCDAELLAMRRAGSDGQWKFYHRWAEQRRLAVVAISHGDDLTQWDSILIPYDSRLKPSFAETTVWSEEGHVTAVIRGGGGVAWVSTSENYGLTWSKANASNLPMPRAKAYLGKLSTGQIYLLSNLGNRDTLVISVSRPNESTLSSMWRLRHGKSQAPRFPGAAKSKQWSYPYGYERDGKLYVVYSIGKEECGLTVVPLKSLFPEDVSLLISERFRETC